MPQTPLPHARLLVPPPSQTKSVPVAQPAGAFTLAVISPEIVLANNGDVTHAVIAPARAISRTIFLPTKQFTVFDITSFDPQFQAMVLLHSCLNSFKCLFSNIYAIADMR